MKDAARDLALCAWHVNAALTNAAEAGAPMVVIDKLLDAMRSLASAMGNDEWADVAQDHS